jgi:hypothetical protein
MARIYGLGAAGTTERIDMIHYARHSLLLAGAALFVLLPILARAQDQAAVAPGAPDATATIDGNYIPNPEQPFGGVIQLNK